MRSVSRLYNENTSQKNMVMGSDGARYQEDCAGEGQYQFVGLDWTSKLNWFTA
jgi:hypothetical protein